MSVIGLGTRADSDAKLLEEVAARGNGRIYFAEDATSLPRIFSQETIAVARATFIDALTPLSLGPDLALLGRVPTAGLSSCGGYNLTYLKGKASVGLRTEDDNQAPLVAFWPKGAGRAVAYTAEVDGSFTGPLRTWPGQRALLEQMVRWTLRSGSRSDTVAVVERRDKAGEITVDAVDGKGEFINFLDSQIGVVSPDRERTVIDLEQVAPGRYRGRFPAPQEGVYLVGMSQRRNDRVIGSQLAGLVVPYAQELRELGVDEARLRELAELTGGGPVNDPRDVFSQARRQSRVAVDIWPWLVGLVTVLMVPEIAMRRLGPGMMQRLLTWRGRRRQGRDDSDA